MTIDTENLKSSRFCTKSGRPLLIGTGTGTKWQHLKKSKAEKDALTKEIVDQLVLALNSGFYHIDTAEIYTTHSEVGAAVKQSGFKREDLFITSKYFSGSSRYPAMSSSPTEAVDKALSELGTSYLDLYLIHTPFFDELTSHGYNSVKAYKELMKSKEEGKIRYLGVSNYAIQHLEEIMKAVEPKDYPLVNQIEFHPYLQNQSKGIVEFCQQHGILVEAYGPLTPLFRIQAGPDGTSSDPLKEVLPKLSDKYKKTQAQILLRYTVEKDILPITTSSNAQRIKESLAIYEFSIKPEDVSLIDNVGSTFKFRSFFKEYDSF